MLIEDELGNKSVEQIFFYLYVQDLNLKQFTDFVQNGDQSRFSDIYFKIPINECESYKEITKLDISCNFGYQTNQLHFDYCHEVLLYCFKVSLPTDADDLLDDADDANGSINEGIDYIVIQFEAKPYFILNEIWNDKGEQPINQTDIYQILRNTIKFEVTGITKDDEKCKQETFFNELLAVADEELADFVQDLLTKFKQSNIWKKTLQTKLKIEENREKAKVRAKIQFCKMVQKGVDEAIITVQFTKALIGLNETQLNQLGNSFVVQIKKAEDGSTYTGNSDFEGRKLENTQDFGLGITKEITHQSDNKLELRLLFNEPKKVSQSVFGRDKLHLELIQNTLLRDQENGLPLQEFKKFSFTLNQFKVNESNILVSKKGVNGMQIAILIISSNVFLFNILLSKSLQDVFALLSTQQITIHMMLLAVSATAPSNVFTYNSYVSQFVQKDMYPTDEIYEHFNFTSSESPVELFEDLGYEGANFLSLTGSLLINFILTILFALFKILLIKVAMVFYRYEFVREQGLKIQNQNHLKTILDIYLQSYLEVLICVILSFIEVRTQGLYQTKADIFSIVFAIFSFLVLIALPLAILYVTRRKFQGIQIQYLEFFYDEISQKTFMSAIFNLIYILRRVFFALILIFMNDLMGLQLIMHITHTLLYAVYMLCWKPHFESSTQLINEFSVLLVSYVLITICNDSISESYRYTAGYFYILFSSFNFLINIQKMLQKILFESIPQIKKRRKILKQIQMKEKEMQSWLEKKEKNSEKDATSMEQYEYAKLLVSIHDQQKILSNLLQKYQRQLNWLRKNDLDINVMYPQKKEIQEKQKSLKKDINQMQRINRESGIRLGESIGGINSLLYSMQNVNGGNFPHQNDKKSNIGLEHYFEINQYKIKKVKQDGNQGPRSIAVRVYGSQGFHQKVRREVCQYILCQPVFWQSLRKMEYYNYYVSDNLTKSCEPFTPTEFLAAAKLYNLPIILFWSETPQVLCAFTHEGNAKEPLYICKKGVLAHHDQRIAIHGLRILQNQNLPVIEEHESEYHETLN